LRLAAEMRAWYRELDLLPGGIEEIIPVGISQDELVRRIMADSGLGDCPVPEIAVRRDAPTRI